MQMAIINKENFANISPNELLNQNWTGQYKNIKSPNVLKIMDMSEKAFNK